MPRTLRMGLVPVVILTFAAGLCTAGDAPDVDRPARHVPVRAVSRQQLDHLEALKLFAEAAIQERKSRLLEAMRTLEAAHRLDPEATPPLKALVPLYLAMDRIDDALAGCRRVLELDPDDCDTAYLYARQLRGRDEPRAAMTVLERIALSPALKERLERKAQVHYDLGTLHEAAQEWAEAEKSFRAVAEVLDKPEALLEQSVLNRDEIDAQAAENWERLGRVCLKGGHPERAVEAFEKAQKRDPGRAPRLAYNLAEVLVSAGRAAEALPKLDEYLRTQPQGVEGYELKAKLQRELGRGADVVPDLEAASGRDPHNTALKLLLARTYRGADRGPDAEAVYNRLLKQEPSPEVYQGLFDLWKSERRAKDVLDLLNTALAAAAPDDEKTPADAAQAGRARAMLQVLKGDAGLVRELLDLAFEKLRGRGRDRLAYPTRQLLATLAARTRQLDVAEALFRSCLPAAGVRGGPREQEVYGGLLRVLRYAHKHQAIVDVCTAGLEKAQLTNRLLFHSMMAEAQMSLGREKEALEAIDNAVKDAGDHDRLSCQLERVQLLSQAGKHEAAATECRGLFKDYNQPRDVRSIRSVLSGVYSAARDLPKAEEQLLRILEDDPSDATANNDLGYLWADQNKNLDQAEKHVRKALDLDREQRKNSTAIGVDADGDNAAYVDSLGWVLFRKGQWEAAKRELVKAAELPTGSDDPVVWDHLADVLHRLGEKDPAAAAWKKALKLYEAGARRRGDGRYDEIKQKLRLLEP